jgi:hypothetical protein
LVVFAVGCGGSNNKGKIEGRWQVVSAPADVPKLNGTFLVFRDDGTVKLEGSVQESVFGTPGKPPGWKYKLLAGDAADFYDLPADATERFGFFPATRGVSRVTINIDPKADGKYEGREMTLTDAAGKTLRLTWVR